MMTMTSFTISKTYSALVCPAGHRLSRAPPHPPRPRARATAMPHYNPQPSVSLAKEGAPPPNSASGGCRKVLSRERLAQSPRKEGTPGMGGASIISDFFFVSPSGFPFVWEAFFSGMAHYHPPPGGVNFSSPFLGSAVERSTLYAQIPGSSPTFQAFRDFFIVLVLV